MTHLERVYATLRREPTDRVPLVGGFLIHPAMLADAAGVTVDELWTDTQGLAMKAYHNLDCDIIFELALPCPTMDGTGRMGDAEETSRFYHGLLETHERDFPTPEHVVEDIQRLDPPEEVHRKHRDGLYDQYYRDFIERTKRFMDIVKPCAWLNQDGGNANFTGGYMKYGYTSWLMALELYPEVAEKWFEHYGIISHYYNLALSTAIRDHDFLPLIYFGDDICYNTGPMCRPELLHELLFPHLKYAFQPIVDSEIDLIWHSDGNILPIIDDLLDAGASGFQGVQDDDFLAPQHRVTVEYIKTRSSRLGVPLVVGSLSIRTDLLGTVDGVKRKVERCIDAVWETGGLFLSSFGGVAPDVPVENLYAMYRHGADYSLRRPSGGGRR